MNIVQENNKLNVPENGHVNHIYPWLSLIQNELIGRIKSQSLHHGVLLVADDGVGQSLLVSNIARALLCQVNTGCGKCKSCLLFEAQSHPDMLQVVSDKPSIGVDLIRTVSEFVATTSQLMGNKVIVIEEIERMTDSASNSLLKTLEEPNKNTYLLLSTTQANKLLATIRSRCEKVRIAIPNTNEALSWLSEQSTESFTEKGLQAYSGSPILYLASFTK